MVTFLALSLGHRWEYRKGSYDAFSIDHGSNCRHGSLLLTRELTPTSFLSDCRRFRKIFFRTWWIVTSVTVHQLELVDSNRPSYCPQLYHVTLLLRAILRTPMSEYLHSEDFRCMRRSFRCQLCLFICLTVFVWMFVCGFESVVHSRVWFTLVSIM